MNIGVLGAVEMTAHALKLIQPTALFTLDESEGRKRHDDYAVLTADCPIWTNPMEGDLLYGIHELKLDVLCVWGWSRLLSSKILDRIPCIGWHPAPLPRGRGRHPIIWQILEGERVGGMTIFRMTPEADTGPILSQMLINIAKDETARTLYDKVAATLPVVIPQALKNFKEGIEFPQDEGLATYYRKRTRADGIITPEMTWNEAERLVRALGKPYCGAELPDGTKIWTVEDLKRCV